MDFVTSNYYARTEVYIGRSNKDINKFIFDEFQQKKEEIEKKFGQLLIWERLDEKKACRIKFELTGVDYFNREDWKEMTAFMLEKSFHEPIAKLKIKLKTKEVDDQ